MFINLNLIDISVPYVSILLHSKEYTNQVAAISVFNPFSRLTHNKHDDNRLRLKFISMKNSRLYILPKKDIREFAYYNIFRTQYSVCFMVSPR